MTKSHPIRILLASLVSAVFFTPAALASWHDPAGSPAAANIHYSVASHQASTHSARAARAATIARVTAELKQTDAGYRFRRVPADQR